MRVFSSGNDAMINIVHASTEAAMKTLTASESVFGGQRLQY